MRKRIIHQSNEVVSGTENWLDLQKLAQVELTSEDGAYPIEAALTPGAGLGWRAAQSGEQTIRFLFEKPQRLRHIQLLFEEDQQERTQEFVLRWLPEGETSYREIVRQQYNFSPLNATREFENYTIGLIGVKVLELRIIPDIRGGDVRASIAQLCVA